MRGGDHDADTRFPLCHSGEPDRHRKHAFFEQLTAELLGERRFTGSQVKKAAPAVGSRTPASSRPAAGLPWAIELCQAMLGAVGFAGWHAPSPTQTTATRAATT